MGLYLCPQPVCLFTFFVVVRGDAPLSEVIRCVCVCVYKGVKGTLTKFPGWWFLSDRETLESGLLR